MCIENNLYIINKYMFKYLDEFNEKWIPKLNKMTYEEIIDLIAKKGKSKHWSKSFYIAFLAHSYLAKYRNYDNKDNFASWILGDVSFKFDFNDVYFENNYIEKMDLYFEEGGELWDFEEFKTFYECPDIE